MGVTMTEWQEVNDELEHSLQNILIASQYRPLSTEEIILLSYACGVNHQVKGDQPQSISFQDGPF